ncbi:hypothetical protein BJ917_1403 [Pseudomonas sp. WPR_5_2]|nr:hypothetical protein BJ917_1403 [Pseudomonas sp. WPR_5_2]
MRSDVPLALPNQGEYKRTSMQDIVSRLEQQLSDDIRRIHLPDSNSAARHAARRLNAVAEHAPAFLAVLAEPWLDGPVSERTQQLLSDCARIHLYARVLDDALDEDLAVCRQNLLRAQPIFWQAVQRIGANVSATVASEAEQLIHQTVSAVQNDDLWRDPRYWGPKNHHLLLVPLLLSENSATYQACRAGLSNLIALVQAGDEWKQGVLANAPLRDHLLDFVKQCLDPEQLAILSRLGWQGAAERIVWNADQLIGVLSDPSCVSMP